MKGSERAVKGQWKGSGKAKERQRQGQGKAAALHPAAVAEPGPADEPDDPSVCGFHGFIVCTTKEMACGSIRQGWPISSVRLEQGLRVPGVHRLRAITIPS